MSAAESAHPTDTTVIQAACVFTGDAALPLAEAVAVKDGKIVAIGDSESVSQAAGVNAHHIDLGTAFVGPGFFESHTHMLMLGQAVEKVQLRDCESISEIQDRLLEARAAHPEAKFILGISWRFEALDGSEPDASLLDEVISDVPVLLDANDLHSSWVNTVALHAMGIDAATPNPIGGEIRRDEQGTATGFLLESAAIQYAWKYVQDSATSDDHDRFLENAFAAYLATGVTSATEMALNEADLAAFERLLERDGRLPFPVTAHALVQPTGDRASDLAQIDEIMAWRARVNSRFGTEWFDIVGVKFILDGVIDACTAAMIAPYVDGSNAETIWPREAALATAAYADAHGLQLALHAIGDASSELALDIVQYCITENGSRETRRPRVEHLETVTDQTIERLAELGITASMQPVHCDPAILDNWISVLGAERANAGFPWHRMRDAGVHIALGTDAPTAPHYAAHNMFIALTARSSIDASRAAFHAERVFSPADAFAAMTSGSAYATSMEHRVGYLAPGARANLVALDTNPFTDVPDRLLESRVVAVFVDGHSVTPASH